ncbi:hypothetical protein FGSG_03113 [Fusarium graminearum PH-1]|uniref:hypothetical protein n=1 Tax=Gibberella zeae (strain ATCC MYA-4620 / CBS 123657 / FGSC 9075 / NRRL 31084 / PH-1) TaxID=229533 RepID=UPI000023E156|nr:hypothetical protein FGSG_03113 [Fusarium graminearum PH-1]ESU10158.1 hypothetical protein FGSG_03113 [Fusarium graminearum PH-1]|eukprot:XP_011322657.1 hypothetical protein FGSG_03113 [Fusarium graminearum PH-1]
MVKNVPTIEAIRSKLGVGVPGDKESKIFRRVVKEFHQDYKTANGTPGAVFTQWTNPTHQDALRRMAEEFLEVRGWAKRFWPDTAGSGTVKKLKWSENHIHSTRTTTTHTGDVTMNDMMGPRHQDDQYDDIFRPSNPYRVPSSPEQISTTSDRSCTIFDIPQDSNPLLGLPNESSGPTSRPLAPVAPMSERAVHHSSPFGTSDSEAGINSPRWGSPVLSKRKKSEWRCSPDLGTPRPRKAISSGNTGSVRHNSRPSSISEDVARLSTEDRILSGEADEPIMVMPPPPRPRPVLQTNNAQRRVNIKYEVEISPGTFRRWDHRGAFNHMSIEEFQDIHDFHDIDSVQFILKRRGMSWDDVVSRDNEDGFKDMRTRLKDRIQEDLAEIGFSQDVVLYSIVIVPIRRTSETNEDFIRSQTIFL